MAGMIIILIREPVHSLINRGSSRVIEFIIRLLFVDGGISLLGSQQACKRHENHRREQGYEHG